MISEWDFTTAPPCCYRVFVRHNPLGTWSVWFAANLGIETTPTQGHGASLEAACGQAGASGRLLREITVQTLRCPPKRAEAC